MNLKIDISLRINLIRFLNSIFGGKGMKKSILITLLMIVTFSFIGCMDNNKKVSNEEVSNSQELTEKEKLDDFEYMYTILKENYPYFEVNKRQNGVDWLSKKNEYIDRIKATTDDESFFNTLDIILFELNNGHTSMVDKSYYSYLKSLYSENSKFFQPWLKQLNNPKAMERYKPIQGIENGVQSSVNNITPQNVKTSILEKNKVAYLSIQSFNMFNIDEDMKTIKPFLQDVKDYKSLIIDIRENVGGATTYWTDHIVPILINRPLDYSYYIAYPGGSFSEEFVKYISGLGYEELQPISSIKSEKLRNLPPEVSESFKCYIKVTNSLKPNSPVGFNGKIYLLIDGSVFSSSEAFAVFAKSTGFATLVGERTGGDGIGSDPAICTLPNSGYCFRFTKEMGIAPDGACNFESKTEPDIKVSAVKATNFNDDEAIQAVLKLVH